MQTLITFKGKNRTVRIACQDAAARRKALLEAFKANPFQVKEPTVDNLSVMKADKEAFLIPDVVFDTLGNALKMELGRNRQMVAKVLAVQTEKYENCVLRDRLLGMPVEEAIKVVVTVDGRKVNAVDVLADKLNDMFRDMTNDGYCHQDLFQEDAVTII